MQFDIEFKHPSEVSVRALRLRYRDLQQRSERMRVDTLTGRHYFAAKVTPEIAMALDAGDLLTGYVQASRYGTTHPPMDDEVGACEMWRFFIGGSGTRQKSKERA